MRLIFFIFLTLFNINSSFAETKWITKKEKNISNTNISVPDHKLFINSKELSKLEKVKNIKNKKAKVNKFGQIYIGRIGSSVDMEF